MDRLRGPLIARALNDECSCGEVDKDEHHLHHLLFLELLLFLFRSLASSKVSLSVIWRECVYASVEKRDETNPVSPG